MVFTRYGINIPPPPLRDLIAQLVDEEYLDEQDIERAEQRLYEARPRAPWFVHLLVAVGAWLGAIFFTLAIALVISSESASPYLCFGLILLAAGIGLSWSESQSIVAEQLSLVLSIIGQILVLGGIGLAVDSDLAVLWSALILQCVVFALHRSQIQRFLAAYFAIVLALSLVVYRIDRCYDYRDSCPDRTAIYAGVYLLAVLAAAVTARVWVRENFDQRDIFTPLRYALPLGLFSLLIFPLADPPKQDNLYLGSFIAAAGLLLVGLWTARQILSEYPEAQTPDVLRVIIVAVAALAILTIRAPGIPAALLVLALGFWRGSKVLSGIAIGFLCAFVIYFYYHLGQTLLDKAFILIATGMAMLGLRLLLARWVRRAGSGQAEEPA